MNLEQKLAKCNQALGELSDLNDTLWMDPPLRDAIDAAKDKIKKIKSIIRLRHIQQTRERAIMNINNVHVLKSDEPSFSHYYAVPNLNVQKMHDEAVRRAETGERLLVHAHVKGHACITECKAYGVK